MEAHESHTCYLMHMCVHAYAHVCMGVCIRVCVREVFFTLIGKEVVRFDFFGINLGN